MRFFGNSKLQVFLSTILSLSVVLYVFYQLDWSLVYLTLVNLSWGWLILAFLVYILNYILRTLRFQILIPVENISFVQLLAVTGLYGMYNYLLPAKSGELALVVLLKNRLRVSFVDGVTSLIAARYFDFVTIALILPFVLLIYLRTLPYWIIYASLIFCAMVFLASLFLYIFLLRSSVQSWVSSRLQGLWVERLIKPLIGLRDGVVRIYEGRKLFHLLFLTLAIWICIYTNFYMILISLGYQINYFQIVIISIIMIPMTLLPFQGFANFGTHEIGWVTAFSIFNLPKADALGIAFSSHIVLLFFALLLGAGGYLLGMMFHANNAFDE